MVIGNAPSALLTVCGFVDEGIRPALIVGTPVGFVNAAESKEVLRTKAVPSVSNVGTRGGTPVTVASLNEIITMYSEQNHAWVRLCTDEAARDLARSRFGVLTANGTVFRRGFTTGTAEAAFAAVASLCGVGGGGSAAVRNPGSCSCLRQERVW